MPRECWLEGREGGALLAKGRGAPCESSEHRGCLEEALPDKPSGTPTLCPHRNAQPSPPLASSSPILAPLGTLGVGRAEALSICWGKHWLERARMEIGDFQDPQGLKEPWPGLFLQSSPFCRLLPTQQVPSRQPGPCDTPSWDILSLPMAPGEGLHREQQKLQPLGYMRTGRGDSPLPLFHSGGSGYGNHPAPPEGSKIRAGWSRCPTFQNQGG